MIAQLQNVQHGQPSLVTGSKTASKLSTKQQQQLLMQFASSNQADREALAAQLGLLVSTAQDQ